MEVRLWCGVCVCVCVCVCAHWRGEKEREGDSVNSGIYSGYG